MVKQKLEKFKETNTESASQNVLQDVLGLVSGDKEKYEEFMQKAKYITTSRGYRLLLYEIDSNIIEQHGGIIRSYKVLARHKETFPHLGNYDSYRK